MCVAVAPKSLSRSRPQMFNLIFISGAAGFFFYFLLVTVQKDFLRQSFHVRKSHEAASGTTSEAVVSLAEQVPNLPTHRPPAPIPQKEKCRLSQRPRHSSSPGSASGVRGEDGKKAASVAGNIHLHSRERDQTVN